MGFQDNPVFFDCFLKVASVRKPSERSISLSSFNESSKQFIINIIANAITKPIQAPINAYFVGLILYGVIASIAESTI